jgi:hypothetical protein
MGKRMGRGQRVERKGKRKGRFAAAGLDALGPDESIAEDAVNFRAPSSGCAASHTLASQRRANLPLRLPLRSTL